MIAINFFLWIAMCYAVFDAEVSQGIPMLLTLTRLRNGPTTGLDI